LLEAHGLGRQGALAPLDFSIRPAEVIGFAGLLGAGRTETARLLFGIDRPDRGTIRIDGKPATPRSPRAAIRHGLGFCPEDRKADGIIPELSVRENIILALQGQRGWFRPLGRQRSHALAREYIAALRIATPDANKPVEQLSGGNQQKVILARWLAAQPRLLIVDEPTRGIDVGAKAEIEKLIGRLCEQGMAILFISSEIDEVARNCHRVIVLRDRRKVGELTDDDVDVPAIMRLIAARGEHG
jgi:simple sugar transport system ATP-binding protein